MSKDLRHVCQQNSTCPDIFCSGYENADFGAVLNNGAENPSATELVIHQVIRDDESTLSGTEVVPSEEDRSGKMERSNVKFGIDGTTNGENNQYGQRQARGNEQSNCSGQPEYTRIEGVEKFSGIDDLEQLLTGGYYEDISDDDFSFNNIFTGSGDNRGEATPATVAINVATTANKVATGINIKGNECEYYNVAEIPIHDGITTAPATSSDEKKQPDDNNYKGNDGRTIITIDNRRGDRQFRTVERTVENKKTKNRKEETVQSAEYKTSPHGYTGPIRNIRPVRGHDESMGNQPMGNRARKFKASYSPRHTRTSGNTHFKIKDGYIGGNRNANEKGLVQPIIWNEEEKESEQSYNRGGYYSTNKSSKTSKQCSHNKNAGSGYTRNKKNSFSNK